LIAALLFTAMPTLVVLWFTGRTRAAAIVVILMLVASIALDVDRARRTTGAERRKSVSSGCSMAGLLAFGGISLLPGWTLWLMAAGFVLVVAGLVILPREEWFRPVIGRSRDAR
jgi:hypothetical protein